MSDAENACADLDFSDLKGRTVMVAGASGLVGTHFLACLRALALKGKGVTTIALTFSPPPAHVRSLVDYGDSRMLQGDIGDASFLASLPQADFIIHAAGYGQPTRFMDNPAGTIKLNTVGTLGLLAKLREGGRFLFVSSSELYNGLADPPFRETQIGTTNTDHPRACYIESKRCGEAICGAFRAKGVRATSVRLGHVYGPGARLGDKRVLDSFIERALREKEIKMLDQGLALRTYCYVADAVRMMWRVLLEGKDPVYNVGGATRISIAELAGKIGAAAGVPVRAPMPDSAGSPGAPVDVRLDISRFEREFQPMAFTSLEEGLRRTMDWHEKFGGNA